MFGACSKFRSGIQGPLVDLDIYSEWVSLESKQTYLGNSAVLWILAREYHHLLTEYTCLKHLCTVLKSTQLAEVSISRNSPPSHMSCCSGETHPPHPLGGGTCVWKPVVIRHASVTVVWKTGWRKNSVWKQLMKEGESLVMDGWDHCQPLEMRSEA